MNSVIESIENLTGKKICECQLDPIVKKYNQIQSFLPDEKNIEWKLADREQRVAFICGMLNLRKLDPNKPVKKKKKKSPIKTMCHMTI